MLHPLPAFLILLSINFCAQIVNSSETLSLTENFKFTKPFYNVTIPENSIGKTYAISNVPKMGISLENSTQVFTEIKFKILSGDKDKFFKAEEKLVGDFCFLFIKTRHGGLTVLNRERKGRHILEIRATGIKIEGRHKVLLETDTVVDIKILDQNDLNPLFYPTDYEVEIPEDTPLHFSILKVSAEDADLGVNGEIYYSFLEDTNIFAIHPTTGIISLTRPLVYSEKSSYELMALAQDRGPKRGTGPQYSRAKVKIRVKKVNFYAPEIKITQQKKIVENAYTDIVATVFVTDRDTGVHGEIGPLEIISGDPEGHFRIRKGEEKGSFTIEIFKALDREATPGGYQLKLRVKDLGFPTKEAYKTLQVDLEDRNDNPPIFSKEIYEVHVLENVPINTPLIRLKVSDRDLGENGDPHLEIVGGNEGGEFWINPIAGVLYTAVELDAEEKAFYSLTVSAIDQGSRGTRKQSSAKVKINILDQNDNNPIFETTGKTIYLNENEPAGTYVSKVLAKDRDTGENAYISYSIVNLKPVPFEVDPFTGVIKTTDVIDFETMRRKYVLKLRASDWGQPYRRQAEVELTIKIRDINDHVPMFDKKDCTGHVPRAVPIGSEIYTFSAVDFDTGSVITYRMASGNNGESTHDPCFNLDSTSGTLSLACDLSSAGFSEKTINVTASDGKYVSEPVSLHFLVVDIKRNLQPSRHYMEGVGTFNCKDTGSARKLSEMISLAEKNNRVEDNDFLMMPTRYLHNSHAPEFIDFPAEIKVNESVNLGTELIKLKARDRDLGYNGQINYVISNGDPDSVFCVDTKTGGLRIIGYLDHEKRAKYILNITIFDQGLIKKAASRMLPITVLDINDNKPKFVKSVASFRIAENVTNGTVIFTAKANDADSGENGKVGYTLLTDTKDFSIDPETGVLITSNHLDRERQDLYELKIRASDNFGNFDAHSLHSEALVRIFIDDINDCAPKFSLKAYNLRVREDIPKGSVIGVFEAFDADLGLEGTVNYELKDEESGGSFKIDKLSGTIRTVKPLDYETHQVYHLTLIAEDKGKPSLSSTVPLLIHVIDVNENLYAPQFPEPVLQAKVFENLPPGVKVLKLNASDSDEGLEDRRISYRIIGGDGIGYFGVDEEGIIYTLVSLDIEANTHFWLTVIAEDHGVVPLHSSIQVFIQVEDVNDNTPLSDELIYYGSILEDSPSGISVLQISATDADLDPSQKISYSIIGGNNDGYFQIDNYTGVISTTSRRLDRENKKEIILEIEVSDGGKPPLTSLTRAILTIQDVNDHAPQFDQQVYNIRAPALSSHETYPIFKVLAHDKDSGINGEIQYSLKTSRKNKFRINNTTGVIYAVKGLEVDGEYELHVRAMDNGTPQRWNQCRIIIKGVQIPISSRHAPVVKKLNTIKVTEDDTVGFLVATVHASDKDNDTLWYDIVGGNYREEFYIGKDNGNILLAKQLNFQNQNFYSLNISVTDGVHTTFTAMNVSVVPRNSNRPQFNQNFYHIEISENLPSGTEILQISATDSDPNSKLVYSILSTQQTASKDSFKLDSISGSLTILEPLDREAILSHVLTVQVQDNGNPSLKDFARILVTVHDHNDHIPTFAEKILQGKILEGSAIGTVVMRALAVDRDKGENGKINYSITSGNIGNQFTIDPQLGIISLAKSLDFQTFSQTEFALHIRATDNGNPQLSSTIPAHIIVATSDNSPPRYLNQNHDFSVEIFENHKIGDFVFNFEVKSASSVTFEILSGNVGDAFFISPTTGIVTTKRELDFEKIQKYNLTISATNMAQAKSLTSLLIHILDVNDHAPEFISTNYEGFIFENAPLNTLVLTNDSKPLILTAYDKDGDGINSLLAFEILENLPKKYFQIDHLTGAIKNTRPLDYELHKKMTFHVKLSDMGKPKLLAENFAKVVINIEDVNDCAPLFEKQIYNLTIFLPTYKNITILKLKAYDPDTSSKLNFNIIEGNKNDVFGINSKTGEISVLAPEKIRQNHKLQVRVSDGKFSNIAKINLKVEDSYDKNFRFQKPIYHGIVVENSTKINVVSVVDILGAHLGDHVIFKILNNDFSDFFEISNTSGVIKTTGKKLDRELISNVELIVAAYALGLYGTIEKVAHVIVNITVVDINDNCPIFTETPYYAFATTSHLKGTHLTRVHAVDLDSGENGEVRYELIKGHGELFRVSRKNGDIELKQSLEGHNKEYQLLVAAYDGGQQPCRTDIPITVKVLDSNMPIFKKSVYMDKISENVEIGTPLGIYIEAESPQNHKLIYTIIDGNDSLDFDLDFNNDLNSLTGPCIIYVIGNLDFEKQSKYELQIRATDPVTGSFSEVPLYIEILDINDNKPEFEKDNYNLTVSEYTKIGKKILDLVVKDNDTGINAKLSFSLEEGSNGSLDYFEIDQETGTIFLKKELDFETQKIHSFTAIATDQGIPALSNSAFIKIEILNENDNAPRFENSNYQAFLSIKAKRNTFVTKLRSSDKDFGIVQYNFVSGNENQIFSLNSKTGVVILQNLDSLEKNSHQRSLILNASVSDGVYSTFTKIKINFLPQNLKSPTFTKSFADATVLENKPAGQIIATVKAVDEDFGDFGHITYFIHSEILRQKFSVDKNSGKVSTLARLDREEQRVYDLPIGAVDDGGKIGWMNLRIKVLDENDCMPEFEFKEYKANIYSNTSVGEIFLKFRAHDCDENVNGKVEYSIYENNKSYGSKILDIFGIDPNSGDLFLIKNIRSSENQVYQFFVRAKDHGKVPLYSDVPVTILILSKFDIPPTLDEDKNLRNGQEKYFISENFLPGTVVTKLKFSKNQTLNCKIISENLESERTRPQFTVDEKGRIILGSPLDYEEKQSHKIGVLVETDSKPPLSTIVEILVDVLDENDNFPYFDSSSYTIAVAENIDIGTSILKVTAYDADQNKNGELRYSFAPDSEKFSEIFSIDTYTGWITNLISLDKETKSEYKFHVQTSDGGHPKHTARTSVSIKLKDYNDQPTLFKRKIYETAVNEDVPRGSLLIQLETKDQDFDLTTPVNFYIISGDPLVQFQIRQTGEIYVNKPLDREFKSNYELEVLVTDGFFTDTTIVKIDILDANDNPPFCVHHKYRQTLAENLPIGSYILTILATDLDESNKLKYYLSGDNSDHFQLDKNFGHLKTSFLLDREKIDTYFLTAKVFDQESITSTIFCTSFIEIKISDINDEPPMFFLPHHGISLPEDADIGSFVYKLKTRDLDLGVNRKMKYVIQNSEKGSENYFKLNRETGIITLNKLLDREKRDRYNLTVKAFDLGTPSLYKTVQLLIKILDINDSPPEFTSKQYNAQVPENEPIDTDVIRVTATSKDIGINSHITYSIISGNEKQKFKINSRTGVIKVAGVLDYERERSYFLAIRATDMGTPPLISMAMVNISITDINDNTPLFRQVSYNAKIHEDAEIGTKVIQIVATDADSKENSRITYYLSNGNEDHFKIDPNTGHVSVSSKLDRENIETYILEVLAKDNGSPQFSKSTFLTIKILDVNDNPPLFSSDNFTAIVQEDKPINYPIIKFDIFDYDIPPNGQPFTFDFVSGNDDNIFMISQEGILRTNTIFSKHDNFQRDYNLVLRVFDNGTKPLYSDTKVHVKVIEESQYPPILEKMEIYINLVSDDLVEDDALNNGVKIGTLKAKDKDPYDVLTFNFFPTLGLPFLITEFFGINSTDGSLFVYQGIDQGDYQLNISVTDGKFFTYGVIPVFIEKITKEMIDNSIILKIRNMKAENFIENYKKDFIRSLRTILNARTKDICILSMEQGFEDGDSDILGDLDILLAVKIPKSSNYYIPKKLEKILNQNLEIIEESAKLIIEEIIGGSSGTNCEDPDSQSHKISLDMSENVAVMTETVNFISPRFKKKITFCEMSVNACAIDNPCPVYKICVPDNSPQGYNCQCPEGFIGPTCQIDISKCHYDNNCYVPKNPLTFNGKAYAQYRVVQKNMKLLEQQENISLKFRTLFPNGNLFYLGGKIDYSILEIVNGTILYRFNLGSGEGIINFDNYQRINDGSWHEIQIERDGQKVRLILDNIYIAQGSAPGPNQFLNYGEESLYFGAEVHKHPSVLGFKDVRNGFVGCIDQIRLRSTDHRNPTSDISENYFTIRFSGVEPGCPQDIGTPVLGICNLRRPCLNGGTCVDAVGDPDEFKCICHAKYGGKRCQIDLDPCGGGPCFFGGKCVVVGNDFKCLCPTPLTGAHCEFGHYCSPNPCSEGVSCEEGDSGPICLEIDVCKTALCHSGSTCTKTHKGRGYQCLCPDNVTGPYCNIPITTSTELYILNYFNITHQELFGIIGAVGILIFIIIVFIIIKAYFAKITRRNGKAKRDDDMKEGNIGVIRPPDLTEFERKKNNLDLSLHESSMCNSSKSLTFGSSQGETTLYVCDAVILNTCSSVEAELETVSRNYLRNLKQSGNIGLSTTNQVPYCSTSQCEINWQMKENVRSDLSQNAQNGSNTAQLRHKPRTSEDDNTINSWTYRRQQHVLSKISEASGSDSSESLNNSNSYKGSEKSKNANKCKHTDTCPHYPTKDNILKKEDITKFLTEKRKPKKSHITCPAQLSLSPLSVKKMATEISEPEPYGFPSLKRSEVGDTYIEAILLDVDKAKLPTSQYDVDDSGCESEQAANRSLQQQTLV